MAKAYVCDACGATMTDPYEAQMREFYVGVMYELNFAFPHNVKTRKCKVHLCSECYHNLDKLAKEGADNG